MTADTPQAAPRTDDWRRLAGLIRALPRQMQHADPFFPETYDYETVGLDAVLRLIEAEAASLVPARTEAEWRALLAERVQIAMDLGRAAGRAEAASLVPAPPVLAWHAATLEWWTDGAAIGCGLAGDEGSVGDAYTPEEATRIVTQHNDDIRSLLRAAASPATPPTPCGSGPASGTSGSTLNETAPLGVPAGAATPDPGWCTECGEAWPCDATVRRIKDGIPHRMVRLRPLVIERPATPDAHP